MPSRQEPRCSKVRLGQGVLAKFKGNSRLPLSEDIYIYSTRTSRDVGAHTHVKKTNYVELIFLVA